MVTLRGERYVMMRRLLCTRSTTRCRCGFLIGRGRKWTKTTLGDVAALEDVVIEVAFLDLAVGEYHLAPSMLDATHPMPDVYALVRPDHLAFTLTFVVVVVTAVNVPARPLEHAVAKLLVEAILSLVSINFVALTLFPFPLAVL